MTQETKIQVREDGWKFQSYKIPSPAHPLEYLESRLNLSLDERRVLSYFYQNYSCIQKVVELFREP